MRDTICAVMWRMRTVTVIMAIAVLMPVGNAAIADDSGTVGGAGLQAASWLATVPYGAAKVAYAISGGVVGSLAWIVTGGNSDIAKAIFGPTMTGHYIVQPQNLTGDKSLHFVGGGSD